jgi:predicted metal-binding membrane protein
MTSRGSLFMGRSIGQDLEAGPRKLSGATIAALVTLVEWIVRHERRVLIAALVAIPLLCWAWIVPMARDMSGSMSGPSAWMMTADWDARHTALLAAMWIVMMIGMMTPSAAPLLIIYAGVMRRSPEGPAAALRVYPMAAGYLIVWTSFSIGAALLQRALGTSLLSPMMIVVDPWATAGLLAAAAVYQLTPLKGACLDACRSPVGFITTRMRPGAAGAFRLGIDHGAYCVGCCWALMLILLAGGVMNLWAIAWLTAIVLVEKLAPCGERSRRLSAAGLLAAAAWVALH